MIRAFKINKVNSSVKPAPWSWGTIRPGPEDGSQAGGGGIWLIPEFGVDTLGPNIVVGARFKGFGG